jgi:23S rRNA pseudouridine1911/1915/1917 synthase
MTANLKTQLIESFQVPELEERVRLSDLSFEFFRTLNSRKAVKNAVKQGLIYINGKRGYTADYIQGGELIEVFESDKVTTKKSIDLKLQVLYEDDYLAVVYKPAGIEVSGNKNWTLEHALSGNLQESTQPDATSPEPIHRLDYPTSGALLVGKTRSVIIQLNKFFEERKIQKIYYAICIGKMEQKGLIETDIDDKPSKSEYEVLETVVSPRFEFLNLVKLCPHTGRRHQLRKHMASIGNPILGDLLYGKEGLMLKGKGLYLHASSLEFVHPIFEKRMGIDAKLPKKFVKIF